jgi:hypothetical protein
MEWQCRACSRQQRRAKQCVHCGGQFFDFKELKFIHNRVHGDNPRSAALGAGLEPHIGQKLDAMPEVRAEIDKRLKIVRAEQAKQHELHAMDRKRAESRRGLHKV